MIISEQGPSLKVIPNFLSWLSKGFLFCLLLCFGKIHIYQNRFKKKSSAALFQKITWFRIVL